VSDFFTKTLEVTQYRLGKCLFLLQFAELAYTMHEQFQAGIRQRV